MCKFALIVLYWSHWQIQSMIQVGLLRSSKLSNSSNFHYRLSSFLRESKCTILIQYVYFWLNKSKNADRISL